MLFHMLFQLRGSDETLVTDITFVRPFIFANVLEVVCFPIMGKFQALLFVTNFANKDDFHIGIIKVLDIFQTGCVGCLGFGS